MKQSLYILWCFLCFPILIFGQSIFRNPINGANSSESNPYTVGQIVDPNITATGIGRAIGMFGLNANDRYDAKSWKSGVADPDSYFEFSLTPNPDKKIDFISFVYSGQTSDKGPNNFAFRSSVDGFTSDIGIVSATGATVSLTNSKFQNITSPITFRIYGWNAIAGTGTFSINDFQFNGIVSCAIPEAPILPNIVLACSATSFDVNWSSSSSASNYFIDIATDSDFKNYRAGYQNKELGNVVLETISGLVAGESYFVRLRSANSCAVSSDSNTIKVAPPETIYNGTWSNGIPDRNKKARFSSDYNIVSTLEACSCQIDPDIAVHVDSGGILTVENGLNIASTATLTFENNASLVQLNNTAVNTGAISYKRNSTPMKDFDYTYWSSPVEDQVLNVLSPNSANYYFSLASGNWVRENGANTMNTAGRGFIIRVPRPNVVYPNSEQWSGATYEQPVQFQGVPYNGIITIPTQGVSQNNLIGNPYPSAIDAELFMKNADNATLIGGSLYFWTHNTSRTKVGSQYVYSSNDYATYNLTGGTACAPSGGTVPSGIIATGQSFFVESKTAGNFVFTNGMRVSGTNDRFFKLANTKKSAETKNRFWLNLTNEQGVFKQLLIGYIEGATNDLDNLYDGVSFNGNAYADFYSINKGLNFAIQGRSLPFDLTDSVPLGYTSTLDGSFTISIDHADGFFEKSEVFLEDKTNGTLHDLSKSSYTFSTLKGEYNDRFVLRYSTSLELALPKENFENTENQLQMTVKDNQLFLKSKNVTLSAVSIYDLKGSLIYQKKGINQNQIAIPNLISKSQILIVKSVFNDNTNRADKIIF